MDTWIALATLIVTLIVSLAGTLVFAFKVGSNNSDMKNSVNSLTDKMDKYEEANEKAHNLLHSRIDHHDTKLDHHAEKLTAAETNIKTLMNRGCAGT